MKFKYRDLMTSMLMIAICSVSSCNKVEKRGANEGVEVIEQEQLVEDVITRVSCGSCYKAHFKNAGKIWPVIGATRPDLFLFMGDNIYADTLDMDLMRERYAMLNQIPEYVEFKKNHKILAVWDDHDYGVDDAGAEFPKKVESQKNFLDAFDYAEDHPARTQQGIYHSYSQGPVGKRLQIINLDTRYHRSVLKSGIITAKSKYGKFYKTKSYLPNNDPSATMLGAEQWLWLEKELAKPSDLCLIVTSIQFITEGHIYEKWSNLPLERAKMLSLLKRFPGKRVIFLSGDRHLAELAKLPKSETGLGYDLVELTTSGLTHAGASKASNRYRMEGSYYNKVNFATIAITWPESASADVDTEVELSIRNRTGEVQSSEIVKFSNERGEK